MIIKTVFGFVGNVRYEVRWWHDVVWKLLQVVTRASLLHGITRARCDGHTMLYGSYYTVLLTRASLVHGITRTR